MPNVTITVSGLGRDRNNKLDFGIAADALNANVITGRLDGNARCFVFDQTEADDQTLAKLRDAFAKAGDYYQVYEDASMKQDAEGNPTRNFVVVNNRPETTGERIYGVVDSFFKKLGL